VVAASTHCYHFVYQTSKQQRAAQNTLVRAAGSHTLSMQQTSQPQLCKTKCLTCLQCSLICSCGIVNCSYACLLRPQYVRTSSLSYRVYHADNALPASIRTPSTIVCNAVCNVRLEYILTLNVSVAANCSVCAYYSTTHCTSCA
jgi:hypothetical protein